MPVKIGELNADLEKILGKVKLKPLELKKKEEPKNFPPGEDPPFPGEEEELPF